MASSVITPELVLWTQVLSVALHDLTSDSGTRDAHQNRQDVKRWIGPYPSKDFALVCSLAGLDPEATHEAFRRVIVAQDNERTRPFVTHGPLPASRDCDGKTAA